MHEYSTRAWNNRRQGSAMQRGFLAAVLVLTSGCMAQAEARLNASDPITEANQSPTPIRPAYDLTIMHVAKGSEGLQLSARLTQESAPLQSDLRWKVTDDNGMVIADALRPVTSIDASPGSYIIEAAYGSALYRQSIQIGPGERLAVDFLLNAGAMRVLATVEGFTQPAPAVSFVYASNGRDAGKLITISRTPGEILRLAAGRYRVESRAQSGNASLVADVEIRPGTLSSLNMAHRAGLLRLSHTGAKVDVHWQVLDATGHLLLTLAGPNPVAFLRPGDYRIEVQARGRVSAVDVHLVSGENRQVSLGN